MPEQDDFFKKIGMKPETPVPDDGPDPREPISDEFEVIEPPVNYEIPKKKPLPPKPEKTNETLAEKIAREKAEKIKRYMDSRPDIYD